MNRICGIVKIKLSRTGSDVCDSVLIDIDCELSRRSSKNDEKSKKTPNKDRKRVSSIMIIIRNIVVVSLNKLV